MSLCVHSPPRGGFWPWRSHNHHPRHCYHRSHYERTTIIVHNSDYRIAICHWVSVKAILKMLLTYHVSPTSLQVEPLLGAFGSLYLIERNAAHPNRMISIFKIYCPQLIHSYIHQFQYQNLFSTMLFEFLLFHNFVFESFSQLSDIPEILMVCLSL